MYIYVQCLCVIQIKTHKHWCSNIHHRKRLHCLVFHRKWICEIRVRKINVVNVFSMFLPTAPLDGWVFANLIYFFELHHINRCKNKCLQHKKQKTQLLSSNWVFLCDPGEARTLDPMIKSHLLYQLSYGVIILNLRHRYRFCVAKVLLFFYSAKGFAYFLP